jgi:hypothetical protein
MAAALVCAIVGSVIDRTAVVLGGFAPLPRDAATFERAAVPILERFAHTPGSQICYIPPDLTGSPLAITHFGVAVFENRMLGKYRVILGFAGRGAPHGQYLLTDGFAIDGAAVGRLFTDWFDRRILKRFEGNVLRGEDPVDQDADADLIEQIKKIREAYYPDCGPGV